MSPVPRSPDSDILLFDLGQEHDRLGDVPSGRRARTRLMTHDEAKGILDGI